MNQTIRPRRSVLYIPGDNERALEKALKLPADALIMDLEDAVAPDAKSAARKKVVQAVCHRGYGRREIIVRINGLETAWGLDDLQAVAETGVDAILLPKIDSAEQLAQTMGALRAAGAPTTTRVWAMAETPRAILNITAIAGADPALAVIVMGTNDLAKAMRLPPDPARIGLLEALSRCVLAARAQGLDIIDGVYVNLSDPDGFRRSCEQGRLLGFDGKTLIHPGQIGPANQAFGVAEELVKRAGEIVRAWEAAAVQGKAVAVVNGEMIERLHADEAHRVLALSASIRGLEED